MADPDTPQSDLIASAKTALDAGHFFEAYELAQQALKTVDAQANPDVAAQVYYILGCANREMGEIPTARTELNSAVNLAQEAGADEIRLMSQLALAQCSKHASDLAVAEHVATQALGTAREQDLPFVEALALAALSNTAWHRGDLASATSYLEQTKALLERLGRTSQAMRTQTVLGYFRSLRGEVAEGRALMEECFEYFRQHGDYQSAAKSLNNLAYGYYSEGNLEQARQLLLQSIEMDDCHHSRHLSLSAWFNLGLLELAQDLRTEAQHSFTRAHVLAQQLDDPLTQNMCLFYLGALALLAHEPVQARDYFQLGYDNSIRMDSLGRRLANYYLVVGCLACDDENAARELWDSRYPASQFTGTSNDLSFIKRLMQELLKPEYQSAHPLSAQTRATIQKLIETLCANLTSFSTTK